MACYGYADTSTHSTGYYAGKLSFHNAKSMHMDSSSLDDCALLVYGGTSGNFYSDTNRLYYKTGKISTAVTIDVSGYEYCQLWFSAKSGYSGGITKIYGLTISY